MAEAAWDDLAESSDHAIIKATVETDAEGRKVGNLERMADLLRVKPELVHHRSKNFGTTPLHWAAYNGLLPPAKLLLAHGADIDARALGTNHTPLHDAIAGNRPQLVSFLLESGARTDIRDSKERRALPYAREKGRSRITLILEAAGARGD